jgi:hypothetical protein
MSLDVIVYSIIAIGLILINPMVTLGFLGLIGVVYGIYYFNEQRKMTLFEEIEYQRRAIDPNDTYEFLYLDPVGIQLLYQIRSFKHSAYQRSIEALNEMLKIKYQGINNENDKNKYIMFHNEMMRNLNVLLNFGLGSTDIYSQEQMTQLIRRIELNNIQNLYA